MMLPGEIFTTQPATLFNGRWNNRDFLIRIVRSKLVKNMFQKSLLTIPAKNDQRTSDENFPDY